MFNRIELKNEAKSQIKGNIGILFVCMLIVAVITFATMGFAAGLPFITGNILLSVVSSSAGGVVTIILVPPFMMGFIMIFLKLREGQRPEVAHIFNGFQIMGKAIWLDIIMGIFIALWTLLLVVPGIIKAFSYILAPYVLAENQGMTAREALNRSKEMTIGHKKDLFVLVLSFLPWALLVAITVGIAGIYVYPYFSATMANAYKKIQAEQPMMVGGI